MKMVKYSYYTNNECLWVQWCKYFHEAWGEVEWYISFFTEWKYLFHCTNEKTFNICFNITCTKLQILKQICKKSHWKTILAHAEHFTSAELNGNFIFHRMKIFVPLHEWENIQYLFYITCTKIQILKQIWKQNHWKTILAHAKHFTSHASNSSREVLRGRLRHAERTHCACCICPG